MKLIKSVLVLLFLSSCIAGKNYYIINATDDAKSIEVYYTSNADNRQEIFPVPDSLGIVNNDSLRYKSYKFYRKSHQQTPFQKINDTIYRIRLQSKQQTLIPYRYSFVNSLEKILIDQECEIHFTDFEYGNDSLKGFLINDTSLGTKVQYENKKFLGDDSYIIQLR